MKDPRTSFLNLTERVSLFALDLATKTDLGERNPLILGCYVQNNITEIYFHDTELVKLGKISVKGKQTRITDTIK